MKKLLSLAMTLAMLCCMATTAFAVTDHVVGTYGAHADTEDSLNDGVYPFSLNGTDTEYEVQIEVSAGRIQHKYAVDVTYTPVNMSITGGQLTWDVNKLEYVSDGNATGLENMENQTITITNYSDLPIYVNAEIEDAPNDFIDVTFDAASEIKDDEVEVPKATVGQAQEKDVIYDIKVAADKTWNDVAEYYAAKFNAENTTSATAATLTITVAKDPTT